MLAQLCAPKAYETEIGATLFTKNGEGGNFDFFGLFVKKCDIAQNIGSIITATVLFPLFIATFKIIFGCMKKSSNASDSLIYLLAIIASTVFFTYVNFLICFETELQGKHTFFSKFLFWIFLVGLLLRASDLSSQKQSEKKSRVSSTKRFFDYMFIFTHIEYLRMSYHQCYNCHQKSSQPLFVI